jgi:hypothetical protein
MQLTVGMVPANVVSADLVIAGRVPELLFACYASPAYQGDRFAHARLLVAMRVCSFHITY